MCVPWWIDYGAFTAPFNLVHLLGGSMASLPTLKRPPTHEESRPAKRRDDDERTAPEGSLTISMGCMYT